jgi:glycosyltransferase involved in cell wall biosynthesis
MNKKMTNILYYNWTPYFSEPLQGGGVSIYCRNIIDYLTQETNSQVSFLYSGFDYTFWRKDLHIKRINNQRHPDVQTYSLVNSPIAAPSHLSFFDPIGNVQNAEIDRCFEQFLAERESFDIIHFHNLEGITANCLKLAKKSGARVIFSLHNYWAVCPQVNLWKLESSPCTNYHEGRACVSCLPEQVYVEQEITNRKLNDLGKKIGQNERSLPLKIVKKIYSAIDRRRLLYLHKPFSNSPLKRHLDLTGGELPQQADLYRDRRQQIVSLINNYVDVALSVSERTTSIYQQYGVDSKKLVTQYIGTKAAQFQAPDRNPAPYKQGTPFKLIYMGPSRKDKGFYFLIEQLRTLPKEVLNSLKLIVASRMDDFIELELASEYKGRLLSLAQSLHRFRYYPGYKYENIPNMLEGIYLGVVPPLWEDNLPQVTFELIACGVPALCSDRGGAKEFVRHPAFIFDPGKEGDFQEKLLNIRENPHLLTEFWQEAKLVKPIEPHLQELFEIYNRVGTKEPMLPILTN